jgi:hypothetical protein
MSIKWGHHLKKQHVAYLQIARPDPIFLRAEIKVGRRSVISYFLYPIIRAFDESLREP